MNMSALFIYTANNETRSSVSSAIPVEPLPSCTVVFHTLVSSLNKSTFPPTFSPTFLKVDRVRNAPDQRDEKYDVLSTFAMLSLADLLLFCSGTHQQDCFDSVGLLSDSSQRLLSALHF